MRGALRFMHGREKEIYGKCLEHVKLMSGGANLLGEAVSHLVEGNQPELQHVVSKIIEMETRCDHKSTEITTLIIKTVKHPSTRSDLLRFIQALQNVAKMVESSAYRLEMCREFQVPGLIKKDLMEFTDAVVQTVRALKAVSYLPFYSEEALGDIQKVHEYGEKADKMRRKLMCDLVNANSAIDVANFYLVNEITERLEDVADKCEEAALVMEIIIASSEY